MFGTSEVRYDPAESENKIKGGNSNWRGPIWFPTSFLIIESLRKLGQGYGANLAAAPANDGYPPKDLTAMAGDLANRMIRISRGMKTGDARFTEELGSSRKTRTGGTSSCFMSSSTVIMGPVWALPTRPVGRGW